MGTFRTFEEIEAWKNARVLADEIYKISNSGPFSRDYKLKNQINGSSGSILDNIAEGFERGDNKEFAQFLFIAKGSAGETRSQLYRAFDRNCITKEQFDSLTERVTRISKQISTLISYLKSSELKGIKYIQEPEDPYNLN